jgi:hypothetical protein
MFNEQNEDNMENSRFVSEQIERIHERPKPIDLSRSELFDCASALITQFDAWPGIFGCSEAGSPQER